MRVFGVILAGGGGRRMGGADKALLLLGGETLLSRSIARLAPQVEQVALSANGDPARFAPFPGPVLADGVSQGPLSGILAALDWAAAKGASHVASVAVDTPFFPEDLVAGLIPAAEGAASGLVLAEVAGQVHPTFGLWPVTLIAPLRAFLASGRARVMEFAESQGATRACFAEAEAFLNLNSPGDLAAAGALSRGAW